MARGNYPGWRFPLSVRPKSPRYPPLVPVVVVAAVMPGTETSCATAARESGCRDWPGVVRGVTVRNWWRWTLRGLAMAAAVGGMVLLALHPSARYYVPNSSPRVSSTATCLSPFNRLTGAQQFKLPRFERQPPELILRMRAVIRVCGAATNGREHIVDALGIGAVILVGLSFLPRRRPVVTVSVDPSLL